MKVTEPPEAANDPVFRSVFGRIYDRNAGEVSDQPDIRSVCGRSWYQYHIVLTQAVIWYLTLVTRYNPSSVQSERSEDFNTMDTMYQNTAYELSHAFPVIQATLFNAFVDAAIVKDPGVCQAYD